MTRFSKGWGLPLVNLEHVLSSLRKSQARNRDHGSNIDGAIMASFAWIIGGAIVGAILGGIVGIFITDVGANLAFMIVFGGLIMVASISFVKGLVGWENTRD